MSPALQAFLTGLIDYAGLFPPAKLPLLDALRNHVSYQSSADAWMLGRFICPAARLPELAPFQGRISISALGRSGNNADEFVAGLRADLEEVAACRERHAGQAVIDVLEVRLPPGEPGMRKALASAEALTSTTGLSMFFEAPSPPSSTLPALVRLIRDTPFTRPAGFKLRTGGLEPSAFPSCQQVAFALFCCLKEGVSFKATAGLHHPFPQFDSAVGAHMHGFVNVFAAGILGHAHRLGGDHLCQILEDGDPSHFRFDEEGLHWRELSVPTKDIVLARQQAMLSFGSCSFDEPRDDLRELGWL